MTVVLTLVETKQIRINIHKRNNTKTERNVRQTIVFPAYFTTTAVCDFIIT